MRYIQLEWMFLLLYPCISLRVIGWYNGIPDFRSPLFPWKLYTHVRYGGPILTPNGSATCNHTQMDLFVETAHRHNVSVLWSDELHLDFMNGKPLPQVYVETIGDAVKQCGIDGIEVDYEFANAPLGIVPREASNAYSEALGRIQRAIGKPVGACISLPGLAPGNWILGFLPWVNVTMLNRGDLSWVSTMSYHWNVAGDIFAWKKDVWILQKLWGIQPERINLGVPLFSKEWRDGKLVGEPTWKDLASKCPDLAPTTNVCNGTTFVGKAMMRKIGKLAKKHNLGGLFPWELSYDVYGENRNTLGAWLVEGYVG